MQWSQIKTLFIISFLILDIYLLGQFFEKQNQANVEILEQQSSTIEQMLEEDIKVPELPEEVENEPFIAVSQKTFSEEELERIHNFKGQWTVAEDNYIVSRLKKPIQISKKDSDEDIEMIVRSLIAFPEEYIFWEWNEELNVLIFFQEKMGRPVYFNQNGVILVFLNSDHEIIFYTQTVLGEADAREDEKNLITPIKAIETLYQANELRTGDEVTKVDMGFHTRIPLANGVQVFVPAWKVTVNQNYNHFVNAIEGWNFSSDEMNFLKESIEYDIEKIESFIDEGKNEKILEKILPFLKDKLEEES